jgi:hypothetical protein
MVSTTATNFGGAVKIAARPNLTAAPDVGVPVPGEIFAGLRGLPGPTGRVDVEMLRRPLVVFDGFKDDRR